MKDIFTKYKNEGSTTIVSQYTDTHSMVTTCNIKVHIEHLSTSQTKTKIIHTLRTWWLRIWQ